MKTLRRVASVLLVFVILFALIPGGFAENKYYNYTVKVGDVFEIFAKNTSSNNSSWVSSNTKVATVTGNNKKGDVTAHSEGEVTITYYYGKYGSYERYTVLVKAAEPTKPVEPEKQTVEAYFYAVRPEYMPDDRTNEAYFYVGKGKIEITGLNLAAGDVSYDVTGRIVAYPNETGIKNTIASIYSSPVSTIGYMPYKIVNTWGAPGYPSGTVYDGLCYHVDMDVSITTAEKASYHFMVKNPAESVYTDIANGLIEKGTTVAAPAVDSVKVVGGLRYNFDGWYTNENCTGARASFPYTINTASVFYAKYVYAPYGNVTITGNSATKEYNGSEQNVTGYTITGLESGHSAAVFYSASGREPGEYEGSFASVVITDSQGVDVTAGYTVETIPGKLVITNTINRRLTIKYVYEDGTTAANDFVNSAILYNQPYSVASPAINGYTADLSTVAGVMPAENKEITVVYRANTNTGYTVEHYKQNLVNNEYSIADTQSMSGTTGALTAAAANSYAGFTAAAFEQKKIAADGSTVIRIFYSRNSYTVTYMVDGAQQGIVENYKFGDSITLRAEPTKTGYSFGGWDKTLPATMPADNIVVSGKFTPNSYTITYMVNGVQQGEVENHKFGESITLRAEPTKTGYSFSGWDKTLPATMPADNIVVSGKFTANSYTVTYMVDGVQQGEVETYNFGDSITLRAEPTKTGYSFGGWDKTLPATMPADNIVVSGSFTVNSYNLSINYQYEGGAKAADSFIGNYNFGQSYSIASPHITGYTADIKTAAGSMPATDTVITVTYKANSDTAYRVEHYKQKLDKTGFDLAATQNLAGTTGAYTAAVPCNYDGFSDDKFDQLPIAADGSTVVKIYYYRNGYTVTYMVDGVQQGNFEIYTFGESITQRAEPSKTGYSFSGWDKTLPATMPADNIVVSGSFTVNSYTVTYMVDGVQQGEVETHNYGDAVTQRAEPSKTGYSFSGWDKTLPATMPADNIVVSGSFTVNSYTVTYIVDGVQQGEVETYNYGDSITLRTEPSKTGYSFSGWDKTLPATMPADNIVVSGSFTINRFTVTFVAGEGGSLNGTTAFTVDWNTPWGDIAVPQPEADATHYFAGWDKSFPENITEDAEFTAAFAQKEALVVTSEGYNGKYDGGTHGINVKLPDGASIEYFADEALTKSIDNSFSNVTDSTVYFKVSKLNCLDYVGSEKVVISKRNITIRSNSASGVYNATILANAGYLLVGDGFAQGEGVNVSVSGGIMNVGSTLNRVSYQLKNGTDAANYNIEIVNGILSISPAKVSIVVGSASKTAGEKDPVFTGTVTGLVGSDQLSVTYKRADGELTGKYVITAEYVSNSNYDVSVTNGELEILAEIVDPVTPLDPGAGAGWALVNLILTAITGVISIVLIAAYFFGKRKKELQDQAGSYSEATKKNLLVRLLSLLPVAGSVIAFVLTENMKNKMILVDKWTILMAALALISVIVAVMAVKSNETEKTREEQWTK